MIDPICTNPRAVASQGMYFKIDWSWVAQKIEGYDEPSVRLAFCEFVAGTPEFSLTK